MFRVVVMSCVVAALAVGLFYLGWQTADFKLTPASLEGISKKSIQDLPQQQFPAKKLGIKMVFVGDVMLSRGVAHQIKKNNDFNFPFLKISNYLKSFDIAFGNLEGPISARGINQGSIYSFRADPKVIEGLKYASFDVMSIANNHILDWGKDALIDTKKILEDDGINGIGAGINYEDANKPALFEIGGEKIAFLAYTNLYPKSLAATEVSAGVSDFNLEKITSKIKELREQKYFVIISLHWGEEYKAKANEFQRNVAHDFIDSGAGLVVGHHPHVVEEAEHYKDGFVAYSLGNFVFDQNFSAETMKGAALEVEVRGGLVSRGEVREVEINSFFQPGLVE